MAKLLDENALLAVRDYVTNEINEALTTVYKIKGSCSNDNLKLMTDVHIGDVWNLNDASGAFNYWYKLEDDGSYTITNVLTPGYTQATMGPTLAGDNVVWTSTGWDNLGGLVDLSPYMPLSGTASLSGNIIPMNVNSYNLGNPSYYFAGVAASNMWTTYGMVSKIEVIDNLLSGGSAVNASIYATTEPSYTTFNISASCKYFDITNNGVAGNHLSLRASYVNLDGNYINLYGGTISLIGPSCYINGNSGPMGVFSAYAENITLNADVVSGSLALIGGSANITQSLYSWFGIYGTIGLGVNYGTRSDQYSIMTHLGITTNGADNLLYVLSNPCSYSTNTLPLASTISQYHIALMENVWTQSQALSILMTGSIPA